MEYYLIFKRNKEQIHSTRYILLSNGMLSETSKQTKAQIMLHFMKISSIDTCTETEGSLSGLGMGGNGERLLNADVVCFLC